jgi:ribosomal protein S18 acetylase RimI-like enzyme
LACIRASGISAAKRQFRVLFGNRGTRRGCSRPGNPGGMMRRRFFVAAFSARQTFSLLSILPAMNDPILIRPFEPRDLDETARLFDLYRQFYEQRPDLMHAERFIRARTENAESVILVAQASSGALIGFCQLYPSFCSVAAAPIYVLYDLFVAPEARRSGVAKALLAAAQERARADGKVRMDLTTAKTNLKAQALYESMGWRRDEVFFTYTLEIGR